MVYFYAGALNRGGVASPMNVHFRLSDSNFGQSGVCAPVQRIGHYSRDYFSLSLSGLSALSRLGL